MQWATAHAGAQKLSCIPFQCPLSTGLGWDPMVSLLQLKKSHLFIPTCHTFPRLAVPWRKCGSTGPQPLTHSVNYYLLFSHGVLCSGEQLNKSTKGSTCILHPSTFQYLLQHPPSFSLCPTNTQLFSKPWHLNPRDHRVPDVFIISLRCNNNN